ncbi:hypothetical protein SCUCBS95973_007027 [Sporothrix curviconia]|uniref:Alpha-L-rhamnosidase six-hairpin glycosidase domain-containing protein n=1 Tax=Sporothrix curviconia TaxID=1260050 RepID=A0ABP0CC92_9PEZI
MSAQDEQTIQALQANWVWIPGWTEASSSETAGRVVLFTRQFHLAQQPSRALCHVSADTRYKLLVNGVRVAVGPSRSTRAMWYYDTLDLAPHLQAGENTVCIQVARYFATVWGAAVPFERTSFPGLTVSGRVHAGEDENEDEVVDMSSAAPGWTARVDARLVFPLGPMDGCLHIYETLTVADPPLPVTPVPWGIECLNGGLPPWRLRRRAIPMPEETPVAVSTVRACTSSLSGDAWSAFLSGGLGGRSLTLAGSSRHTLDLQAETHSTAFLRWVFASADPARVHLQVTYSEGYERESGSYPFFRNKGDRLDATDGLIIGPGDDVTLDLPGAAQSVTYEPFWFRTFRLMRVEITVVGTEPVELVSFAAAQTNYPLAVKAAWRNDSDAQGSEMWDVSVRTLRNCMFDGYSDCPYYEQLQYSGDSRSVGLFHYVLAGDDRLMRQTLMSFAASTTAEGLTQSRVPSHSPQLIAGFPLYWVLQVCDHHLYFGDTAFTRALLPRVDGVLEYFHAHVDSRGLVSGLPSDLWQYVDWVAAWGATDAHPDKGVPTAGRASNCHTFFSLLYCYVLQQAAQLVRHAGRPAHADEYEQRAAALVAAVRAHCYDGRFFTDSTADVVNVADDAGDAGYSQHCQVFAVLCGAVEPDMRARLLTEAFASTSRFSRCSYVMLFYAFRAFAIAGDNVYNGMWPSAWDPWRKMLANNLSTWAEDDVRHRSDCHAWGSVPLYEFCTELAGVQPRAPGCAAVLFRPRIGLSTALAARVALGRNNTATVTWSPGPDSGETYVKVQFASPVSLACQLPGQAEIDYGVVDQVAMVYHRAQ